MNKVNFAKDMKADKIKYNRNTRVKVEKILSFLTVPTQRPSGNWLGKDNGWTKIVGTGGLIITGALINGSEYVSSIEYGKRLDNPYNNYVNPFYLFDILNDEGRAFFLALYKDDINSSIKKARKKAEEAKIYADEMISFWAKMRLKEDGE